LTLSLFVYVGLYHPRIFEVHARTLAFTGLLLGCLIAVRFVDQRFALTPVLLVASILTIAYPRRFAAGVTVIFVVVVAVVIRADIGTMVTLFACGYATALMLNEIRTRTKIITAGTITGAIAFFTAFAFGMIGHQELPFALRAAAFAAANALLAALIIQGALPFVERGFRVATALTLLEYRDANRPLLQRLAREAPGTYNHALVLGTMSEAACKAIGADGLLAHVGALYHDIGKILKAEYFSENQQAQINRHDHLAPTMSLLIILGHVKDGLELAREYALPRVLYPFIAEHHGTTLVRYFHHVASEKQPRIASGRHDREVAEAEFRYPGPKPQSKETAVLMLCDGVEGAVRALPDPTAGRIEAIVHQVLQARLKDGQFDECDITLRELHKVEESIVKSLCTFYHGRVTYPKDTKDSSRSDSTRDSARAPASKQLAG
ncbi:MAG TPA: HDIG domain-containing protein, partial [Phycisphaerae bacterium]|nr:HDIG domain-containing protein [Phycisphaerae bacterium]